MLHQVEPTTNVGRNIELYKSLEYDGVPYIDCVRLRELDSEPDGGRTFGRAALYDMYANEDGVIDREEFVALLEGFGFDALLGPRGVV